MAKEVMEAEERLTQWKLHFFASCGVMLDNNGDLQKQLVALTQSKVGPFMSRGLYEWLKEACHHVNDKAWKK